MKINPVRPAAEVELAGETHQLHYNHADLAYANYLLVKQGLPFRLTGALSVDFFKELGRVIDGDTLERLKAVIASESRESAEAIETVTEIPDFDYYKIGVLLWAGLLRKNPELPLDVARDLITHENQVSVAVTVLTAVNTAMSAIKKVKLPETEADDARPLASGSTGEIGLPAPEPSESETESSGA